MKTKKIFLTISTILSLVILFSCSHSDSGGGSSNPSVVISTQTVSYNYDESSSNNQIFKIDNTTKTVNLLGAEGKQIYLVKYNLESSSTPEDAIRVLSSANGIVNPTTSNENILNTNISKSYSIPEAPRRSLLWAQSPVMKNSSDFSRSILGSTSTNNFTTAKTQITPSIGLTKDMYIPENDSDGNTKDFYIMKFRIRAFGDHCIIWAPVPQSEQNPGVPNDKCSDETVFTTDMANELRDKFETAYPYETEMFGEKASQIFTDYNQSGKTAIENVSDTAAYTNIVVYDLEGTSKDDIAVGFFWQKDYYPSYKTLHGVEPSEDQETEIPYFSNEGSYLYMTISDIIFSDDDSAINSKKKRDWVVQNENGGNPLVCFPDSYLTLCHEYMHSLQFARKTIEQGFSDWPTAFGEILGTLCEDVMKDVLQVPKSYSVENYRVLEFCNKHYFSSVMDPSNRLNYSNLLAFGIYLTRKYGGAKLIGDMV